MPPPAPDYEICKARRQKTADGLLIGDSAGHLQAVCRQCRYEICNGTGLLLKMWFRLIRTKSRWANVGI